MGKTVRTTEPLAFSFQIWPGTQLTQKEVTVSVTESILPVLSCGKHQQSLAHILSNKQPITWEYEEMDLLGHQSVPEHSVVWYASTAYNILTVIPFSFTNYTAGWLSQAQFDLRFSLLLYLVKKPAGLLNEFLAFLFLLLHAPFLLFSSSQLIWRRSFVFQST